MTTLADRARLGLSGMYHGFFEAVPPGLLTSSGGAFGLEECGRGASEFGS